MKKFINSHFGRCLLYTLIYVLMWKAVNFEITLITIGATILSQLDTK